jgi:hypothetical protein
MAETTKCLFCRKPLRPAHRPYKGLGYEANGLFCTQRCGYRYALAAVRSGRVS